MEFTGLSRFKSFTHTLAIWAQLCAALLAISTAFVPEAGAYDYFGRLSLGSFTSTERFAAGSFGSDKNDYQTYTGRIYLRVNDLGERRWELVSDIRDKYDQFDELNKTKLQLDPKNHFQVRQLYTSDFQSNRSFNFIFGRFSLLDAGGSYVDGIGSQYRASPNYRIGAFGGLSPYDEKTQEIQMNTATTTIGAYSSYEPRDTSLSKNLIVSHGLVSEMHQGDEDRRYLYQNVYYQWNPRSRILNTVYLDMVPTAYLQTWGLNWDQGVADGHVSHIHLMGVDTIRYRRLQGLRERLEASPYQQVMAQWDWLPSRKVTVAPSVTHGRRSIDSLTKTEYRLKANWRGVIKPQFDFDAFLGSRRSFTTDDQFIGGSTGYYSLRWEFTTDLETGTEQSASETLHPIIVGINASFVQDKDLFYVFSFEYAKDEKVQILAALLKLTYRFGSKTTAPLRDGAPARGVL